MRSGRCCSFARLRQDRFDDGLRARSDMSLQIFGAAPTHDTKADKDEREQQETVRAAQDRLSHRQEWESRYEHDCELQSDHERAPWGRSEIGLALAGCRQSSFRKAETELASDAYDPSAQRNCEHDGQYDERN